MKSGHGQRGNSWRGIFVFALRSLRKSPGFGIVAVMTLALGIGANTAIFDIMDAVLLRPLLYPQPERLLRIWQSQPKMSERRLGTAPPEFVACRNRSRAFSSVAGYQRRSFDLTTDHEPEQIPVCQATAGLFSTLGVSPLIGRTFTAKNFLPLQSSLAGNRQIGLVIDGRPPDEFHWADNALVSSEYFRVMGIPLLTGRTFSNSDTRRRQQWRLSTRAWPGNTGRTRIPWEKGLNGAAGIRV